MAAGQPYMVSALRTRRFTINIPDVAGVAATVESLVKAVALPADASDLTRVLGCKILSTLTVGTARAAFTVGDSAASQLQYVNAGADWVEPSVSDYQLGFIKSAAAAFTATVILYIG